MSIVITAEGVERAISAMRETLDALGGKDAGVAVARTLNRGLEAARTETARQARRAYTAPEKKLFDNIFVRRAKPAKLEGTLEISGKPGVSRIHFLAIPNRPGTRPREGVSTLVRRGGMRRVPMKPGFDKPFIMKKRQGGYGIFARKRGADFGGPWKNNVEMLFGPSPVQALQRRDTQEKIAARVEEVFAPRLRHEIDVILAGIVRGGK